METQEKGTSHESAHLRMVFTEPSLIMTFLLHCLVIPVVSSEKIEYEWIIQVYHSPI